MSAVESTTPDYPNLTPRQLSRVDALKAARAVLVARSPLTAAAADPVALVSIATFIETGDDTWKNEADQ